MRTVHSFDVFDTCLLRSCAFPSDVFCEMVASLNGKLTLPLTGNNGEDFRSARIQAEVAARLKTATEEVTLSAIWRELAAVLSTDEQRAFGEQQELELERRQLRPNRHVLSRVEEARRTGKRIVFISDTYLPLEFLRDVLKEHGFFFDGDGLFVSSEVGLIKQTSNLFKFMLQTEGVDASAVHHLGDNVASDVRIPRSLGIDATLSTDAALDPTERALLGASVNHKQITSKLAARSRNFRLATSGPGEAHRSFIASFLGPFLLTFASWVLWTARRDGVQRLYFFSRDCYLLSRAARILAPQFGIEIRYLYVSRQALLLPSIPEVSEGSMPWLNRSFEKPTIQRLLGKLELADSVARALLLRAFEIEDDQYVLRGNADWAKFWGVIGAAPVRQILDDRISRRRTQAIRYLEAQGLRDPISWGVVDLGWLLTGQTAVRGLLGIEPDAIRGYYLGLHADRNPPIEAGHSTALFYNDAPDRVGAARPASIFTRVTILEHVLGLAPHGSVHHYESSGPEATPICANLPVPQQDLLRNVETLVDEFTADNIDLAEGVHTPDVARAILDRLVDVCMGQPKREWVNLLRCVQVSVDQNNMGAAPLASPMNWNQFAVTCLPRRVRRHFSSQTNCQWVEASESISSNAINTAKRARAMAIELARKWPGKTIPGPGK